MAEKSSGGGVEEMPPSNLRGDELAEWWRKKLGGRIETTADDERICPYCKAINPCTGVDNCIQCNKSLRNAKRTKTDHRHTSQYY